MRQYVQDAYTSSVGHFLVAEQHDTHSFFIGTKDHEKDVRFVRPTVLYRDQARQLRDELTAFLGETPHLLCADGDLCERARYHKQQSEQLQEDYVDLENAHCALHRENETLRQRVASLEKDNADLRRHLDGHTNVLSFAIELAPNTRVIYPKHSTE